ncbi:MAG: hypothetical protein ACKOBH_04595, partial [bacterium]
HRRLALGMVRAVGGHNGRRVLWGFMIAAAAISMWISNAATTLLLIPVAIGAGILAVGILRGGGRNLAIAIAALGLITVAVALVVDLPKALDPVNALPYSDATTRLLGGFWAQLSAGIALVVSGAVLFRGSQGGPSRRTVKPAPRAVDLAPAGGN